MLIVYCSILTGQLPCVTRTLSNLNLNFIFKPAKLFLNFALIGLIITWIEITKMNCQQGGSGSSIEVRSVDISLHRKDDYALVSSA